MTEVQKGQNSLCPFVLMSNQPTNKHHNADLICCSYVLISKKYRLVRSIKNPLRHFTSSTGETLNYHHGLLKFIQRNADLTSAVRLFSDFKHFFSHSAEGAHPVFGEFFKGSSGSDTCFGVAEFGIINVVTNGAKILFHSCYHFKLLCFSVLQTHRHQLP